MIKRIGRMDGWKAGRLEGWKTGRLEGRKDGGLEGCRSGRSRTAAMLPFHLLLALSTLSMIACTSAPEEEPVKNFYDIEVTTIAGETVKLEQFRGKTLLIVNTASKCGFTGQYDGLQKLYESCKDREFVILGFPSNDFLRQEPGTNEDIENFCRMNYGVTFPMFGKISVKGNDQHPLYSFLTSKETNPEFGGKVTWNFNKFLISNEGQVINRFGSMTKPSDKELIECIEQAVGK